MNSTTRRDVIVTGSAVAAGMAAAGVSESAGAAKPQSTPEMTAWQVGAQAGIDSLQRVRRPAPVAGPGEVVVRMRAAALNHRDLMIVSAHYGARKPEQRIPLGDGSGEILEVGAGVTGWQPGTRVTAPHFANWIDGAYSPAVFTRDLGNTADGWLAERIVLPAAALVRVPDSLSHEEAASLGAAGITAWAVIEAFAGVKAGEVVLALGTGGVSILALQIAKMAGATAAITSSSDAKLALARELGADITVNYRKQPDWPAAVRAATGGRGVDIVVETVGLATLSQSLSCCAPNARVGLLGALGGRPEGGSDLQGLIAGNAIVKGITSGSRRMLEDLLRAAAANGVRPRIDRSFAFDDAVAAYRYLDAGDFVGKIVITAAA